MSLVNRETKLYEVVVQEPAVITVLSRFNITLGVGDKSVKQICDEHQLDLNFFLTILNTFLNHEYFPENVLRSCNISEIVEYLNKTNNYYRQFLIPNIEQHFNLLIMRSSSKNSNLELMRNFFIEVKKELLSRIEQDNSSLFSEVITLHESQPSIDVPNIKECDLYDNIEDNTIENKLNDLINMFVIHLSGNFDANLCQAVLLAIINLRKDICQNNRIRNKILMPIYKALSIKSI